MVCRTHKYANGGQVKSEYEKPTYWQAVKDRTKEVLGLAPKAVKAGEGGRAIGEYRSKQDKEMAKYKDGGKVKKKC